MHEAASIGTIHTSCGALDVQALMERERVRANSPLILKSGLKEKAKPPRHAAKPRFTSHLPRHVQVQ